MTLILFIQKLRKFCYGVTAVADGILFVVRKLGKCLAERRIVENGVKSKAVLAFFDI